MQHPPPPIFASVSPRWSTRRSYRRYCHCLIRRTCLNSRDVSHSKLRWTIAPVVNGNDKCWALAALDGSGYGAEHHYLFLGGEKRWHPVTSTICSDGLATKEMRSLYAHPESNRNSKLGLTTKSNLFDLGEKHVTHTR
jgi:hypothetical protein